MIPGDKDHPNRKISEVLQTFPSICIPAYLLGRKGRRGILCTSAMGYWEQRSYTVKVKRTELVIGAKGPRTREEKPQPAAKTVPRGT